MTEPIGYILFGCRNPKLGSSRRRATRMTPVRPSRIKASPRLAAAVHQDPVGSPRLRGSRTIGAVGRAQAGQSSVHNGSRHRCPSLFCREAAISSKSIHFSCAPAAFGRRRPVRPPSRPWRAGRTASKALVETQLKSCDPRRGSSVHRVDQRIWSCGRPSAHRRRALGESPSTDFDGQRRNNRYKRRAGREFSGASVRLYHVSELEVECRVSFDTVPGAIARS